MRSRMPGEGGRVEDEGEGKTDVAAALVLAFKACITHSLNTFHFRSIPS